MKLTHIALTACTMLGGLNLAVGTVQARDLTVVSWGGSYQDGQREIYFKPFAKELGKPVLDESWDGGYGVLQAKVKAGETNWDVVQVEAEELALGCADGIYEPINWEQLGGKDKFIPAGVSDCGVGAIVWSTGIAYNGDTMKEAPQSWADFWDVKKFPGKRSLRKSAKYSLEFALMADGVAPKDVYTVLATPEGVDRAFKKLEEIKPHIVWWEAGAQPVQLLSSGEVVMSSVYNGRINALNRTENKNFGFVWPGSIYAVDSWAIIKGTPLPKESMDFVAFASKADNQAKLPEYITYGLPNIEADKFVDEKYRKDLPTTPANMTDAVAIGVDFWTDNSESLNQRFNAWLAQ